MDTGNNRKLGGRLTVGHGTLNPGMKVRLLPPQPKNMNYYKGNFRDDRQSRKDENHPGHEWLVGHFMNEKLSDFRGTQAMSVKFWYFKKNQKTEHKDKFQRFATECTVVIKGRLKAKIENDEFEFQEGDYVVVPPNIVSNLALEALEESEGITIKAPSLIPDDTVKL